MTNINPLVEEVKRATSYATNKLILREKIQTDLHLAHNGGMFKITPELFAFVSTWPTDFLYLEDIYQNPIEIDKQVFLAQAGQCYHKAMNEWHIQHNELKQIRKI